MARVEEVERDREAKDAFSRGMVQLNSKRQEGLLATIDVLQEEVQNLTNRLGELEKGNSPGSCVCDEQKSREKKALVNPEPPTVASPMAPLMSHPLHLPRRWVNRVYTKKPGPLLRCEPTPVPFQRTSPASSKFVDEKTKESGITLKKMRPRKQCFIQSQSPSTWPM